MEKYNFNKQADRRNYGIDLLRIVSMFLIVILHVLGQGGILQQAQTDGSYAVSWFMEIGAYCAVNCYALISGFVGFSEQPKNQKYSRYIILWMQVVFYCILVTGIFCVIRSDVISKVRLFSAIFPVAFKQYWYFSAYIGVFFMMPWLNKAIRNFSKKELTGLVVTCAAVFSFYSTAMQIVGDPFLLSGGYSFLWLMVLYIIGAYIKRYEMYKYIKKSYLILIVCGLVIFTWGWKMGMTRGEDIFVSYISPTILGIAVALLLLFCQINVVGFARKCVRFAAPAAFGVYLIHTHPLVFEYIIQGRFSGVADLSVVLIPAVVLGIAAVIFTVCILIDKLRTGIFEILRLNRLAVKMEEVGRKILADLMKDND